MDNIQVLERAFRLLEAVAKDAARPHTLSELIQKSGLKPATAARIVKSLANLGYLEQLGRKTGYVLGRMAYELARDNNFSRPLVTIAKPLLQEFSRQTGEYICLSELRDGQRVILDHILSTRSVQINGPIVNAETPYRSVSGHVLLAGLPPDEQRVFFQKNGAPGAYWPEITTENKLIQALAKIRVQGRVVIATEEITSLAVPICDGDRYLGAIGVFLPTYRYKTEHRRLIQHFLETIPEQILQQLKKQNT